MMKCKFPILFVILLLQSLNGFSQSENEFKAVQVHVNQFFETFKQFSISKAIDGLYESNLWKDEASQNIEAIEAEFSNFTIETVGEYVGYSFIQGQYISECVCELEYFIKYDRQPIRILFTFYKPRDIWLIYSLEIGG